MHLTSLGLSGDKPGQTHANMQRDRWTQKDEQSVMHRGDSVITFMQIEHAETTQHDV